MNKYIIEVCVDSIDSLHAALRGGAGRIELCTALGEGGLTPSTAFVREALRHKPEGGIYVMIRPRSGDFCYSLPEQRLMLEEIAHVRSLGADGIVIGALTPEGDIDSPFVKEAISVAGGEMGVTFHRAFDVCRDPYEALETLIDLGIERVLTSGSAPSALRGAERIASLIQEAQGRIKIMPGAGISPDNIRQLRDRCQAKEFHLSAKSPVTSRMQYRNPEVYMGAEGTDEYLRYVTSEAIVRQALEALTSP